MSGFEGFQRDILVWFAKNKNCESKFYVAVGESLKGVTTNDDYRDSELRDKLEAATGEKPSVQLSGIITRLKGGKQPDQIIAIGLYYLTKIDQNLAAAAPRIEEVLFGKHNRKVVTFGGKHPWEPVPQQWDAKTKVYLRLEVVKDETQSSDIGNTIPEKKNSRINNNDHQQKSSVIKRQRPRKKQGSENTTPKETSKSERYETTPSENNWLSSLKGNQYTPDHTVELKLLEEEREAEEERRRLEKEEAERKRLAAEKRALTTKEYYARIDKDLTKALSGLDAEGRRHKDKLKPFLEFVSGGWIQSSGIFLLMNGLVWGVLLISLGLAISPWMLLCLFLTYMGYVILFRGHILTSKINTKWQDGKNEINAAYDNIKKMTKSRSELDPEIIEKMDDLEKQYIISPDRIRGFFS